RATLRLGDATANASGRVTPGSPVRVDLAVDATVADLAAVAAAVPALAGLAGALDADVKLQGDVAADRIPAVHGTVALRDVAVRLPRRPSASPASRRRSSSTATPRPCRRRRSWWTATR